MSVYAYTRLSVHMPIRIHASVLCMYVRLLDIVHAPVHASMRSLSRAGVLTECSLFDHKNAKQQKHNKDGCRHCRPTPFRLTYGTVESSAGGNIWWSIWYANRCGIRGDIPKTN